MFKKLKKIMRMNSIKTSMILYFMGLIAIIVLFLSFASYQNTIRDSEILSINYTVRLLNEINARIDAYIENMKNMGTVVVDNEDVRNLMAFFDYHQGNELTPEEEQELQLLKQRATTHMGIVAKTGSADISNIALITKYHDIVLSDPNKTVNPYSDFNLASWYLAPLSYKDDIVVSPSHVQRLIEGEYTWVISISKAILNPKNGDVTGVMLIDLNYRVIEDICKDVQLGKSGYVYLVDDKSDIIYHPEQLLIYSGVKQEDTKAMFQKMGEEQYTHSDDNSKIYIRNISNTTGWSAVGVVNTSELLSNRNYLMQFYFTLAALAILFSVMFAVMISTNITRPIKKLEATMHHVEEGDFSVQAEVEQNNEIGHLSKTFNNMVQRTRLLMDSEVRKEEEKRKIEIRALQAQINPHFLYNTLETIIWMSASGKNDEVVEVTEALAALFRTSISQGDSLVELRVEVENIKSYLTIQKMRYKDKLNYEIDIPPQIQNCMIPKLILQPIVENAIYHGIKPSPQGGSIYIAGFVQSKRLILTVEDTGVGMPPQKMETLLSPSNSADTRGIGVLNVQERIRLVFGAQYGLRYRQRKGGGTRVEIHLPVIEESEAPHEEI